MKLLIENFKKFLNEQKGQQSISFDTEGVQTTIEFLGMHTPYDQTVYEFRINGQEVEITSSAIDIEDLALRVESELEEDENYWFLADPPDERIAALEQIGADPSAEADERASYRDRDTGGMY
jgi:hypothetical protein